MEHTYFQLFSRNVTGYNLAITGGVLLLLAAIKYYSSGGVCRIKKDLSGKMAVITGGNTGIGKETALDLARRNCDLIIGARDKGRLEETIKEIHVLNPKTKAIYSILDLGDKQSIQQFAEFVNNNTAKIDFLINNAGVMMIPQRTQTKDGLQMQIGINHFGHFYLTYLLFPLLKKADHFRITNVSSRAHLRTTGIDFEDIHHKKNYSDIKVYGRSKLANIYFTRLLQKKINQANLNGIATSLHPGVVRTQLTRYFKFYMKALLWCMYPIAFLLTKSSKQGAQTTLYTVLEDAKKLTPGEYYSDCAVGFSTEVSKDLTQAEKLWKVSEQTWGVKFDL